MVAIAVIKSLNFAIIYEEHVDISNVFLIFAFNAIKTKMKKDINRIKVVLVEKKRTNKWLAEQLGKDPATVSKWCTNSSQPDLVTLRKVAELLGVDIKDLLNSSNPSVNEKVIIIKNN